MLLLLVVLFIIIIVIISYFNYIDIYFISHASAPADSLRHDLHTLPLKADLQHSDSITLKLHFHCFPSLSSPQNGHG